LQFYYSSILNCSDQWHPLRFPDAPVSTAHSTHRDDLPDRLHNYAMDQAVAPMTAASSFVQIARSSFRMCPLIMPADSALPEPSPKPVNRGTAIACASREFFSFSQLVS
jgi:hypothetical protein